jgi:uncharacterized protein YyaL (SSP411 family)
MNDAETVNVKHIPDTHLLRTRHLDENGSPLFTNHLIHESSPYLLQHAHNPVNWRPWGEAALIESKNTNLPLFVSIGYATCHWCHVMEEESFEDLEIADFLNRHFISVKVDREERPDLDAVYMGAVQLLNGNGGWPLNVFLTPSCKPFFGGTYFPARDGDRGPSTGFLTLLRRIHEAFIHHPESIEETSEQLTQAIRRMMIPEPGKGIPGSPVLEKAESLFKHLYDKVNGGMKGAPKFPSTLSVRFLMRRGLKPGGTLSLEMALNTLTRMAQGGIFDQIGGGFHRYSTDERWLVPHFEKMLYDNALLTVSYLEAFQISGDETYRRTVEDILNFIMTDMRSEDGLFYSATDADSPNDSGEREEGLFFTWTPHDIDRVLPQDLSTIAKSFFSIEGKPHYEGRHIPHICRAEKELAELYGLPIGEFRNKIKKIKEILCHERLKRKNPLTDTKILTAWNGLMISAYAKAGFVFNHQAFIKIAENTASGLFHRVFSDGRLFRSFQNGKPRHMGCLDDHAFLEQAFLDLYESTFDVSWLKKAKEIDQILERYFEDKEDGGFFMTASDHEALIVREKPSHDNATPSGNSVEAMNLLRLHSLTGEKNYLARAEKTFKAVARSLEQSPHAFGDMLLALDHYHGRQRQIVIVANQDEREKAESFLDVLRQSFIPDKVVTLVCGEGEIVSCGELVPMVRDKMPLSHGVLAYVCEKGRCGLPCSDPQELEQRIRN